MTMMGLDGYIIRQRFVSVALVDLSAPLLTCGCRVLPSSPPLQASLVWSFSMPIACFIEKFTRRKMRTPTSRIYANLRTASVLSGAKEWRLHAVLDQKYCMVLSGVSRDG